MIEIQDKLLNNYKFVDLFSGIGGFHFALNSFGAECVFASEWDRNAAEVYFKNFKLLPEGDITKIDESEIPNHDILCAGFPCQAFSISGKQQGFNDTRGTLFFEIARIAKYHQPKILFLENVKNIKNHDKGHTFEIILNTLNSINYNSFYKVLNSSEYGLPQNRERMYIVAFHKSLGVDSFEFPKSNLINSSLNDILEFEPKDAKIIKRKDTYIYKKIELESNLFNTKIYPNKPLQIGIVNKGGQGERIYHPSGHSITLSSNGGGVGAKTGLYLIDGIIRKLSPRECARLQGFPDNFILHESVNQSYKQFGNSVSINVLQEILLKISETLNKQFSLNRIEENIYE